MTFKKWLQLCESEMTEQDFIRAIHAKPNDRQLWLVYADWLEERGDPRHELIRKSKGVLPSTRKGKTNRHGERMYNSFRTWRKAIEAMFPGADFEGDKDTAQAMFHGMGVGEWGGESGMIYNTFTPPKPR